MSGLADVMGVDDKHWSLNIQRGDVPTGRVLVEVTPC